MKSSSFLLFLEVAAWIAFWNFSIIFLNTCVFDSSSLFRVKPISQKESCPPGDQACQCKASHQSIQDLDCSELPPRQMAGMSKGEKDSVLMISMLPLRKEEKALQVLWILTMPLDSVSSLAFLWPQRGECVSHSLRNATPKAESWTYFTEKE